MLKKEDLYTAVSELDDDLLREADGIRYRNQQKKTSKRVRILAALVAAALLFAAGAGIAVFASETSRYNEAVRFFNENGLSTDGLSSSEIKAVHADIVSRKFTYAKTAAVILNRIPDAHLSEENPTPGTLAELWDQATTGVEPAPASIVTAEEKTDGESAGTPPAPTETPPPPEELDKPVIGKRFERADGTPEEIRFFVDTGFSQGAWYDSLYTRSVALLADSDGSAPDPDNVVNAAILKRNRAVEEELGVKITVKEHCSPEKISAHLKPILMAGNDVYDVLSVNGVLDPEFTLGGAGSLLNFEDPQQTASSCIDFQNLSPWWSKPIYDTTKLNDKKHPDRPVNFFITGDLSSTLTANTLVAFVNRTMWDRYADKIAELSNSGGSGDVYEIVENGYWTMDLIMDLTDLCYVRGAENPYNGPNSDYDQVGLLTDLNNQSAFFGKTAGYFSSGANVRYTARDENGIPVASFNSENNLKFYQKIAELLCEHNVGNNGWRCLEEGAAARFAEGGALLFIDTFGNGSDPHLADMEDDWIILPLPMLDHEQYDPSSPSLGYTTSLNEVSLFAICSTSGKDRLPAITATLELMGYYSEKWVTPAAMDEYTGGAYSRDAMTRKMLGITRAGTYTDFSRFWPKRTLVYCGGDQVGAVNLVYYIDQFYANVKDLTATSRQGNVTLNMSIKKLLNEISNEWWKD
ncbi:MAG: hypothetical protein IJU52_04635 [Clostridia bacterium]|nr:hypothetical protein [Clostridia bacterium]